MHRRGRGSVGHAAAAVAVAALSILWSRPVLGQSDALSGDPIAGRRIFVERRCDYCHSIWGNGGTLGPDFATVGVGRSLQQLAGLFWNHTPRMIETVRNQGFTWPTFTEQELANFISYIQYVRLFDESGDPDLGEHWFVEKRCADCHAVGGSGGDVGPALDEQARYVAPITLAQEMWNHGPDMREEQASRGIPMPRFIGRELADLQAYIRRASTLRDRRVILLEPPDPLAGRRLFRSKGCARCHGRRGRGTAHGPDLRSATERLRVAEIAGELWNHSAIMDSAMSERGIPLPQFGGSELPDIIAFLYYLRFDESAGDVGIGEQLYALKGCASCHGGNGIERTAPDLSRSSAVRSPLSLATAMWDHAPAMYDRTRWQQVEWPQFQDNEMLDLAAYLHSLATRDPQQ